MDATLITLIINIVLAAFILFGFLGGLRGLKKSTFDLVVFIVQLLVVFFLTPVISNLVLNITIDGKTINNHILGFVNNLLGAETASSSFIKDIVANVPIMVVNIAVTILLIVLSCILFKIIAVIVYKIMFKKDKEKVIEKCEIVNGAPQMVKTTVKKKKHRIAGGFVGALHGFLLALVVFMPLCGVVSVFNDVAGVSTVSAEATTQSSAELKSVKDLIQENLPKEVLDYAKAIDDSILFKIGKIGNISETSLNVVSKTSINGTSVRLGEEVRQLVKTYDSFVDFALSSESALSDFNIETIFNDIIENPNNYDFNKLYTTVDLLFESNLINAMGKDALKFAADMLVDGAQDENTLLLMNHIKSAVYNYADSKHSLKDEINSVVKLFEISAKSGLIKAFNQEEILVSDLKAIMLNEEDIENNIPENKVLTQICDELTSSYLLQKLVLELSNYGLDNLEIVMNDGLEFSDGNNVVLTKIDSSNDYSIKSKELQNLVVNALELYELVEGLDIDAISVDFYNIFDADLEGLVNVTGNVLNTVISMPILKDTGVFAGLCDAMSKTEYNNYVDFNLLKTKNTISIQFNYLAQSIGEIKDSGIINTIRYITTENTNDSINEIVDKLAITVDGKTYVSRIINPLLKCDIFKNTLIYGLDEAHKYIEEQMKALNPDATIHKFNTSSLMTEDENSQLINVLNNLVQFMDGIDVSKLSEEEFVETIIYSDLNNVGRAFESIRTSNLFKDYDEHQGVYNDLMDTLAGTKFNKYFDFKVAKNADFTWTLATEKLIEIRDEFDNITISTDSGDVKLLKYFLTSENYDNLLDSIQGKTINLKALFELELIKPISVELVNIINSTIKEFVGEELGASINNIDTSTNLSIQAQNINDIINKALAIDFNSLDINNLDDENLSKVEALLDELEINANLKDGEERIGVFKESYNALLIKIANTINLEIKNCVGETLGIGIVELDGSFDITVQADSIMTVLKQALKLDLSSMDLDTISDEDKSKLNVLLDALSANIANFEFDAVFAQSYNALLNKLVNLINENIQNVVGKEGAGSEIITLVIPVEALTSNIKIRQILDEVLELAGDFKSIDIKTLNTENLFALIDVFKNNSDILDGVFAPTYNALLVYAINTVNIEVANAVGTEYSTTIETYTGETDVTVSYNYIKEVVESAVDAFSSITEGQKIEDIETNKLDRFTSALDSNKFTRGAYTAIENYLLAIAK